jgi:hypothetical protein
MPVRASRSARSANCQTCRGFGRHLDFIKPIHMLGVPDTPTTVKAACAPNALNVNGSYCGRAEVGEFAVTDRRVDLAADVAEQCAGSSALEHRCERFQTSHPNVLACKELAARSERFEGGELLRAFGVGFCARDGEEVAVGSPYGQSFLCHR